MPLYEYQCQSCEDLTEVMQRFSDSPLETCKKCGGELRKLLSAPSFQFKGTGWYVTDYARKEQGGGDGKDKASGSSSSESTSGKAKSADSSSSEKSSSSSAKESKGTSGATKAKPTAASSD